MPKTAPGGKPSRSFGHAALVAAGIFLSRVAGLVRERVFAHYLGNSEAAGAFRAALRIPNFLQNLFGEGVLSASFIPVYSKLLAEGDDAQAGLVAGVVASVLALAVSVMVLIGVTATPAFVDLVAPGFSGSIRDLTITLVRILFPGVGLLVLSAWCLGILNSHRRFFVSYVAPVAWNAAMIVTLVVCGRLGWAHADLAIALAWGTVAGSLLQLAVQVPQVFRAATGIRFRLDTTLAPVREVFRNLGPVVVSRGVVQLSAYIDGMIASFLGAAAVSGLGYAQTVYLLPISLFGMSVAAAELPEMSGATGTPEEIHARLRERLAAGQRQIAFFVIPSVAALLFLGKFLVSGLFQTGQFGARDTLYVWYILLGSTVGLLAATWGRLYSSGFYALRDTRTPLAFAVVRVILTGVLGWLFAFPLRGWLVQLLYGVLALPRAAVDDVALGAVGLTSSAGVAAWIEFLLLRRALTRRIGSTAVPVGFQATLWGLALAGVVPALALTHFVEIPSPALRAIAVSACFGVVYLALAFACGVPEARRLARR